MVGRIKYTPTLELLVAGVEKSRLSSRNWEKLRPVFWIGTLSMRTVAVKCGSFSEYFFALLSALTIIVFLIGEKKNSVSE